MRYCSKCGESVNNHSIYCAKCGSYLEIKENVSIKEEEGKFCCVCGAQIQKQYCGEKRTNRIA